MTPKIQMSFLIIINVYTVLVWILLNNRFTIDKTMCGNDNVFWIERAYIFNFRISSTLFNCKRIRA